MLAATVPTKTAMRSAGHHQTVRTRYKAAQAASRAAALNESRRAQLGADGVGDDEPQPRPGHVEVEAVGPVDADVAGSEAVADPGGAVGLDHADPVRHGDGARRLALIR